MRVQKKAALMMFLFVAAVMAAGCAGSNQAYTAPPESLTIQDAAKIDLNSPELGKLTKTRIDQISDVSFLNSGEGFEIQYRYLSTVITVKIVKFASPEKAVQFWNAWTQTVEVSEKVAFENGVSVVAFDRQPYTVRAWKKGSWFTYVGVPLEVSNSRELRDQVKDYVNYRYSQL